MKLYALLVAMALSCVSYCKVDSSCELNYDRLCFLTPYSAVFYKAIKTRNKDFIETLMNNAYYSRLYNVKGIDAWDLEFIFEIFFDDDSFFEFIRDISVMKTIFPELCKINIEEIRRSFPITVSRPGAYVHRGWLRDYVLNQYDQWIKSFSKTHIDEYAAFLEGLKQDQNLSDGLNSVMPQYCVPELPSKITQALPIPVSLQIEKIASLYDDPWSIIDQDSDYCTLRIQLLNDWDLSFGFEIIN